MEEGWPAADAGMEDREKGDGRLWLVGKDNMRVGWQMQGTQQAGLPPPTDLARLRNPAARPSLSAPCSSPAPSSQPPSTPHPPNIARTPPASDVSSIRPSSCASFSATAAPSPPALDLHRQCASRVVPFHRAIPLRVLSRLHFKIVPPRPRRHAPTLCVSLALIESASKRAQSSRTPFAPSSSNSLLLLAIEPLISVLVHRAL
ncbi:hypothetical protein B0H21DRAFT_824501 [Amylocystis lapponica]|nr:hypothetical protein B0H21DRAFT_824501 [Amylocystis lapponica]